MSFGWINWINMAVVIYLILVNIVAAKKGLADSFNSKYLAVNILEQVGRYGCMAFMILPIFTKGWKFGFYSVTEMLIWVCFTILLLIIYSYLWFRKVKGGAGIYYGLAIVPAVLFLLNGILLRHPVLVIVSFVFGVFHFIIVKENICRLAGNTDIKISE